MDDSRGEGDRLAAAKLTSTVAESIPQHAVYDLKPFLLSRMEVRPRHSGSRHGQQLAHRPLVRVLDDARVLAGDRVVHHRPSRERAAHLR
jgi:hypothetical protein